MKQGMPLASLIVLLGSPTVAYAQGQPSGVFLWGIVAGAFAAGFAVGYYVGKQSGSGDDDSKK